MPTHIDATFGNAQDITLDAFRAPAGSQGEFRDMTIKVGGRAFRVSFANPDAPEVRFASFSFFNSIFNRSSRTAVRERISSLVTALSERREFVHDLGLAMSVTGFHDNVRRTLSIERGRIAGECDGNMAVYGFSDVRDTACRLVTELATKNDADGNQTVIMRPQVINSYNTAIGLPGETESAAQTIAFVRDNDRGALHFPESSRPDNISADDRDQWAAFLRGNDIDLFSKIRKARSEAANGKQTGWAGEIARQGLVPTIHDLVRKNFDPRFINGFPDVNFVLGAVADSVAEIADTDFGELNVKQIEDKISKIVARHAPPGKEALVKRALDHVSMAAFWRQTSKLGLDFFKARGQTVVFDWTTFDGRRTDGSEIADKWWKKGDADVGDHFGVAITNSEMRHLSGEKYAAKTGAGRVVRIDGALTPEEAEREVEAGLGAFDSLDGETLARVVAGLESSFSHVDAKMFRDPAVEMLKTLPPSVMADYLDGDGTVTDQKALDGLCARVFDGLRKRIEGTSSQVARAALLANLATVFQAEMLKDARIVAAMEDVRATKAAENARAEARPLAERQLAGFDRGFGAKAFFSSRTGRPNELGEALLLAGGDVVENVSRFRRDVAAGLGVPEENLFGSRVFSAFVTRLSREVGGRPEKIVAKLGAVKAAEAARTEVDKYLQAQVPLTPEAQRVFDRRGDWDLNRLVYKEAVAAAAENRAVNVERLRRNAAVIRNLCVRAVEFVGAFERTLDNGGLHRLRLDADEAERLVDAYLDREGSAVNSYRLTGSEEYVARFDSEAEAALAKVKEFDSCVVDGTGPKKEAIDDRRRITLAINAVALRGKAIHGQTALAILRDLDESKKTPPAITGDTPEKRLASFARSFADKIKDAWGRTMLRAEHAGKVGHDDGNTAMKMAFSIYVSEHPEVKAFLDRDADESLSFGVQELLYDDEPDPADPIRNVMENVMAYGRL